MKKFLVLFLMVALVPFSIGCWNDDDDDAIVYSNVLLNQSLPVGSFAANAIEAADFTQMTYEIVIAGVKHTFFYKTHKAEGTNIVFTFYKPVVSSAYASYVGELTGKAATSATVKFGTYTIATAAAFTMPTISTTPSTTGEGVTMTATIAAVDISQIPATYLVGTYAVSRVSYAPTGAAEVWIGESATEAVANVNSTTPTFKVYFTLEAGKALPADLSTVTFEVVVKNEDTGASYTLTSADGLTIARVDDTTASIAIKATNSLGKTLSVGTKYSVAITKTSMTIDSKKLALPGAYYFNVTQ
jgi:hypothetical protein